MGAPLFDVAVTGCGLCHPLALLPGREEVDRIQDRRLRHAIFGAKVELLDPVDNLGAELRRIHIGRLHPAGRDLPARFDRDPQHHLPAKGRILTQFGIVDTVERSLVTIEQNLNLFVGSGRTSPGAKWLASFPARACDRTLDLRKASAPAAESSTVASRCQHSDRSEALPIPPLPTFRLTAALPTPPLDPPPPCIVTRERLAWACPAAWVAGLFRRASAPSLATGVSSIRSLKVSLNARTPVFSAFLGAAVCSAVAALGRSCVGFSWAFAVCFFSSWFSSFFSSFFSSLAFLTGSGFLCSFLTIIASRSGIWATTGRTGFGTTTRCMMIAKEQAEEHRSAQGAAVAPIALVIMAPGHDRRWMRNRGKLPFDGKFMLAPLVASIRIVNFIVQVVEFIEASVRLRLEFRLFFEGPADFPVETGDATPKPYDMSGGILNLRQFSPEELTSFQFVESVEEIAGVPQGVETQPVGRKGFKLCLCRAHLTLQLRKRSPDLLDLRVQRRQFLL